VGLSEELTSDSGRIRRRVVFPENTSNEEKHEETVQSDSEEESLSDETEDELESVSDSYIDSISGSDSHDEIDAKRKSETSDTKSRDALHIAEDSSKDKSNLNSENESKKRKLKCAVAEAEYKLLNMMDADVGSSGNEENECEEHGSVHDDESSDEVPAKKLKLTIDVKKNQPER
jgi:hypothetical protein